MSVETSKPIAFHLMAKPSGPACNLECQYCFYLAKEGMLRSVAGWRMPDAVLDRYVRSYIQSQEVPVISFTWQGGEPTRQRCTIAFGQIGGAGRRTRESCAASSVCSGTRWSSIR